MIIESQLLRETFESCMIFFHGIFHRCFDFEVPGQPAALLDGRLGGRTAADHAAHVAPSAAAARRAAALWLRL